MVIITPDKLNDNTLQDFMQHKNDNGMRTYMKLTDEIYSEYNGRDTAEEIKSKLKKAYCPQGEIDGNPVLEIWKFIIFQERESATIQRPEKFGGDMHFDGYDALEADFASGALHPADLKDGTAALLDEILAPIREYYDAHPDNYEKVKRMTVTR